jgi:hypothetical protein
MNITEHLTKTLKKNNIEYKIENKAENGEIQISIIFQSSFKTLSVIVHEQQEMKKLTINFVDQPEEIVAITIKRSEWELFVEQMILPAYQEDNLTNLVVDSWKQERTDNLLIFDNENQVSEMYFIGLDDAESWGYLHQQFIMNSFVRPACINEAGKEGGHWGAAQYKTAYSNSFINYEGIQHGAEKMLFFISCNYLPSQFGISAIQTKSDKFRFNYNKNMPVDLLLAIESMDFPFMDKKAIIKEIAADTPNALFFTYVLLSYFGSTKLLDILPQIIQTKNQEVVDYLINEYKRVTNKEVTERFNSIIQAVE